MDETDIEWFHRQASIEKTYNIFYKAPVISIQVTILYVKKNNVVDIKRFKHPIQNNKLTHNEITAMISRNRLLNNTTYRFNAMAMYNAIISPQEIISHEWLDDYFISFEQIQDVSFHDTIEYLNDDNELFIVLSYHEHHSKTKHNRLQINNRKTRRHTHTNQLFS
jgi:hypothetical protein